MNPILHDRQTLYFIRKGENDIVTDAYGRVMHATKQGIELETVLPKLILSPIQFEEFEKMHKSYDDLFTGLMRLDAHSPNLYELLTQYHSQVENNYTLSLFARVYAIYDIRRPFDFIKVIDNDTPTY